MGSGETRCEICGWRLVADAKDGCVSGNCSYRPHEGTEEYFRIQARRKALTAKAIAPECRACKQPLLDENTMVADGCPCNSPRGVNHGLVPARVCTCSVCDPAETGSARAPATQGAPLDPYELAERNSLDLPGSPAVPATQGAAVAGPARECPLPCVLPPGHEGLHRLAPPPPASEPPRSYSPTCAGTCWPPCVHHGTEVAIFMREDRNRLLVQNADLTAAKAALEVQLAEALTLVAPFGGGDLLVGIRHLQRSLDREIEEHQRHHNNEDALRAELAAERAAHEGAQRELVAAIEHHGHHLATLSEAFGDWPQGNWTILEGWVKAIRGMREALIAAAKALRAGATCAQDDGRPFTAIALSDAAARAALAASGPAKEGG